MIRPGADKGEREEARWSVLGEIIDAGYKPTTMTGLRLFPYAPAPRLHLLAAMGFNPRRRFIWSPTALQLAVAAEDRDIDRVKFLLEVGGNVNAAPPWGIGPYQFRDIGATTLSPDRRPIKNFTALQHAANTGDGDLVKLLIDHGADVNAAAAPISGATALQLAAARGDNGILRYLIHLGAAIDSPGARFCGRTALEGAAEHGRVDTVSLLLSEGCQITGAGRHQYIRAVAFAQKEGHNTLARLLQSKGGWTSAEEAALKTVDVEGYEEKVKERWKKMSSCDCGGDGCDDNRSVDDEMDAPPCWQERLNTLESRLDEPDMAETEDPLDAWLNSWRDPA